MNITSILVCGVPVLLAGDIFKKNHRKKSVTKDSVFLQHKDVGYNAARYQPSSALPFIFVNPPVAGVTEDYSTTLSPFPPTEELQVIVRQEETAESVAR